MTSNLRRAAIAVALAVAGVTADAQNLLVQTQPGEVLIGPMPVQETVLGVPLALRASGFFRLTSAASQVQIDSRIVADLTSLQDNIGSLVDSVPLPSDDCKFVVRIWGKRLVAVGQTAVLKLNGDITAWECFIGKNQLGTQPFDADLPFTLAVTDPRTIAVRAGNPSITLGGPLGGATQLLLQTVGVDIDGKVKDALDGAVLGDRLKATIPADLLSLDPVITRADFASDGGALAATLQVHAALDGRALGDLVRALVQAPDDASH